MCQNPSGRILKNPAKYGFEIADAISKPILPVYVFMCKGMILFSREVDIDREIEK